MTYIYFIIPMQLIVITPDTVNNELQLVNELFSSGLQRLHLRKAGFTIADTRNYLSAVNPEYHTRLVLCDHFEMLGEFKLGGVHLNSHIRNDEAIWKQIKALTPASISTSFHTWDEVAGNSYPYAYVFISPVFDSISKAGYTAGIDLAGAMQLKRELAGQNKYCPQIIGLGGVGVHQLKKLYRYDFDGAAMLGAIWLSDDPVGTFRQAQEMLAAIEDD